VCIEYTGAEFSAATVQEACSAVSGQFTSDGCPTAGLVGRCINQCGQSTESVGYFYEGTPADLQKSCTSSSGGYYLP